MSKIICGDAAKALKTLPPESVNMCVTSPPYYGLRDYGESEQIGIEQTPDEYIARLIEVFDEVYRVLKKDGTLWLNIGDSYATGSHAMRKQSQTSGISANSYRTQNSVPRIGNPIGCKTKDMIGIPWLLAFALRERGWYLRSDIIWYKKNCLPESAKDRPTKTYEHIFLLAKSRQYYFDYKAIQEPIKEVSRERYKRGRSANSKYVGQLRRKRDVWEVSTNTYKMDEHFAMFPEQLIEPCILAGSAVGGIVLDPFFGSGTTGAVAKRFGREYIGIDLNARYLEKAKERIDNV